MKRLWAAITALFIVCVATPPAAPAQQKTVKECRDEWRASTDANKGRQKDYVAKCRSGGVATAPAPSAPAGTAKTARACRDEWRASTDPNKGTQKDYVAKCRSRGVGAAPPSAAPEAVPTTSTPSPAPEATTRTAAAPAKPAPAAHAPTGANQYSTEAQAKARCPADTVVWVNLNSKVYHFAGTRNYGNTKEGAYMCEKDALGETFRAAKNEKHP